MNRERIKQIRDQLAAIKKHETDGRFNMGDWIEYDGDYFDPIYELTTDARKIVKDKGTRCDTTACIAGWACLMWPDEIPDGEDVTVRNAAAKILGLTDMEAGYMFYGDWIIVDSGVDHYQKYVEEITIDETIEYLDAVLENDDPNTVLVIPED